MTNFKEIGENIGSLVQEKNQAYGDSFKHSGEILKFLYPNGVPVEKYTTCLALVRILDKIFRLATNPNYNNENCWHDIAGYCILMAGYEKEKQPKWTSDRETPLPEGVRKGGVVLTTNPPMFFKGDKEYKDGDIMYFYEGVPVIYEDPNSTKVASTTELKPPARNSILRTKCGEEINTDIKE